jgi:hypothetical protein
MNVPVNAADLTAAAYGRQHRRQPSQARDRHCDIGAVACQLRSPEQITAYLDGPRLIEPGVVPVSTRPDSGSSGKLRHADTFGGMADTQ